jgi:hypothetical protein
MAVLVKKNLLKRWSFFLLKRVKGIHIKKWSDCLAGK